MRYMAGRKLVFATDEYYHVFNRGIARQPVYFSRRDYERFLLTLSYYRYRRAPVKLSRLLQLSIENRQTLLKNLIGQQTLVEIICFVCLPNHIHLALKQTSEKGISTFMSKSINSYTKYINTRHERVGDLFQGVFKAVHIETNEQLIHLSRYIHLNPSTSHLITIEKLATYPWSSYPEYIKGSSSIVNMDIVLSQFKSTHDYMHFVNDQAKYQLQLKEIEHLTMES